MVSKRLPYVPGLDGLRALAVIAVLLYHAETRWAPGGFLGVEVFFVISGYLITMLLLVQWGQHGYVDLLDFWLRRARRLLPALFVMLWATLTYAVLFLPEEVATLRSDALAAVGYFTNWYLVFSHQSYFVSVGRPSLLRHLWSLAVEEQFYLLWPLLFALGMRWLRRRRMIGVTLALATASAVGMAVMFNPDADPSRVYYGTDTRAAGFLIGAVLALGGRYWARSSLGSRWAALQAHRPSAMRTWLPDGAGLLALGVLVGACLGINEFQAYLYRGGFVLVAIATAVLITVILYPQTRLLARILGCGPLRWIGLRSYSIYLWHWPIFMVTRPQLDVTLTGLPLLALRLALTLMAAELSYRCIEMPIRTGALERTWRTWHERRGGWVRSLGAVGVLGVLLVMLGQSLVSAQLPPPPAYLAVEAINTSASVGGMSNDEVSASSIPTVLPTITESAPETEAPSTPVVAAPFISPTSAWGAPGPTLTPVATPLLAPTLSAASALQASAVYEAAQEYQAAMASAASSANPVAHISRITAVGDSVMVSAVKELSQTIGDLDIDAAVGRQVLTALNVLQARQESGQIGTVAIIHLGNNGVFSAKQFDEIMAVLTDTQRVVFVNVNVPRTWEDNNNKVLAEGAKRYPKVVLVDWKTASAGQPDLFWKDGIHPRPEGAKLYASLIAEAVQ